MRRNIRTAISAITIAALAAVMLAGCATEVVSSPNGVAPAVEKERFLTQPDLIGEGIGNGSIETTHRVAACLSDASKVRYEVTKFIYTDEPVLDYARLIESGRALGYDFEIVKEYKAGTDILKDSEGLAIYSAQKLQDSDDEYLTYVYLSECWTPSELPEYPAD